MLLILKGYVFHKPSGLATVLGLPERAGVVTAPKVSVSPKVMGKGLLTPVESCMEPHPPRTLSVRMRGGRRGSVPVLPGPLPLSGQAGCTLGPLLALTAHLLTLQLTVV